MCMYIVQTHINYIYDWQIKINFVKSIRITNHISNTNDIFLRSYFESFTFIICFYFAYFFHICQNFEWTVNSNEFQACLSCNNHQIRTDRICERGRECLLERSQQRSWSKLKLFHILPRMIDPHWEKSIFFSILMTNWKKFASELRSVFCKVIYIEFN